MGKADMSSKRASAGTSGLLWLVAVAIGVAAWLSPERAAAQSAVTGESIAVHATFHHVGVQVNISGDDNGDATAALEVNVAGGGFVPAHRLSRAGVNRFVGSAFGLSPGDTVEVRVTLSDPDGVTGGTLTDLTTLRSDEVPASSGANIHVSASGDDSAGDGSEQSPFATVAHGLGQAVAGDTVLVHAGTYHEEVTVPRGGTSDAPITLAAAGDGDAILDGAEPALKAAAAWTDEGAGVYSAPVTQTRYVAVDGVRLWRYESLADLQSLALGTNGGFYFENNTVYVRLPGDGTPAEHEIQVSSLGRALWLEGTPHVVVRGLIIRCYGGETYSEGMMVRDGSHQVWVVDTTFENVMPGIWVKGAVDDLVVMESRFSDPGLAEFPWAEVKAQGGMESGAIGVDNEYDGQGIIFHRNTVQGSFDGLHICGDEPMAHPNNADVEQNLFVHLADDGLETDGECSNVRIVGNRLSDLLVGVSVAPAVTGPTYVLRNLILALNNVAPDSDWMTRAMKFNVGDSRPSGETFAYHNTATTTEADQNAFACTDDSQWQALHVRNNIWVGADYAFYFQNAGDEPFTHDYDLLHSTGDHLVRYQGTNYETVADYFDATGHCEHCRSGDPLFVDPADGDYGLDDGSPAVDQGEAIAGINDDYVGTGPDMGALEQGADQPQWPDAGVLPDAGVSDGGSGGSGSTGSPGTAPPSEDDGGCGCRVSREPGVSTRVALALSLLGLGLACLRARRRRR
jgi:MYXO-CTERM domain-containing protein